MRTAEREYTETDRLSHLAAGALAQAGVQASYSHCPTCGEPDPCPGCGGGYQGPDGYIPHNIKCPAVGAEFKEVPSAAS